MMNDETSSIGHAPAVWTGCLVAVELVNSDHSKELLSFQIVPDHLADFSRGFVAEGSRLAQALMGRFAGERISYPVDDIESVAILGVQLAERPPDEGIARQRQENLARALRQTELANMIAFAASFNSKWGDYDPARLTEEWERGV